MKLAKEEVHNRLGRAARMCNVPNQARPDRILMIDIGGSNVKVMVSGNEVMRKFPSGRDLHAKGTVAAAQRGLDYVPVIPVWRGKARKARPPSGHIRNDLAFSSLRMHNRAR